MKESIIIIYIAAVILLVLGYFIGGWNMILDGLNISIKTAYRSFLMLLASFIIIGQLNVLLTAEVIEKMAAKI